MKTKGIIGLVAAAVLLMTPAAVFAQAGKGGGWAAGSSYNRLYNPATVETVSGEVVKIEKVVPTRGMSYGVHVQLKTKMGEHSGPSRSGLVYP